MKTIDIVVYELKHFLHSPFKIVALILFTAAAIYGLHNGARLYTDQRTEREKIMGKMDEQREKVISYYEKGEKGPADRPWMDITTPFWAIWNVSEYHFKTPSPSMVYSIGQAEQYGYYKMITVWASPFDTDMAEEIANPERLQTGTLDFAFVVLFLLPLLMLILLYDIHSTEAEHGFVSLIEVQTASKTAWVLSRMSFYGGVLTMMLIVLVIYGTALTSADGSDLQDVLVTTLLYLSFWSVLFFGVVRIGRTIMGNTLRMIGLWFCIVFIIPGAVHQLVSVSRPMDMMTELIDAQRDEREKLFAQPDSVIAARLVALFPEIQNGPLVHDPVKKAQAVNFSASALANELMKDAASPLLQEQEDKNHMIRRMSWISPYTYFQNRFNSISGTHFNDYKAYRSEIQGRIDRRIRIMVREIWNDRKVDKERYSEYEQHLK